MGRGLGSFLVAIALALVFASSAAAATINAQGSTEQVDVTGLNPYARNGGGSGASGLYQFMPSTWSSTLARMGMHKSRSIYSARWQARAAAWKFRHDGYGEWSGAGC